MIYSLESIETMEGKVHLSGVDILSTLPLKDQSIIINCELVRQCLPQKRMFTRHPQPRCSLFQTEICKQIVKVKPEAQKGCIPSLFFITQMQMTQQDTTCRVQRNKSFMNSLTSTTNSYKLANGFN